MKALACSLLCLLAAPSLAQTEGPLDPLDPEREPQGAPTWQWPRFDFTPGLAPPAPKDPRAGFGNDGGLDFRDLGFGSAQDPALAFGVPYYGPTALLPRAVERLDRGAFEKADEAFLAFRDMPGGILLGLSARPDAALEGARLEWTRRGERVALDLRLRGGSRLPFGEVSTAFLRDTVDFVGNPRGGDSLVDVAPTGDVWRAPEVRDPKLAALLLRVDRTPLRSLPVALSSKSVILDREIRLRIDGQAQRLVAEADLEVRLYGPAPSMFLRESVERRAIHAFLDGPGGLRPATPLPPGSDAAKLTAALGELLPLARWAGFLRWAEVTDPAGFARLRGELGLPAKASPAAPAAKATVPAPAGSR